MTRILLFVAAGLMAWLAVGLCVGVAVGRVIRAADRRRLHLVPPLNDREAS